MRRRQLQLQLQFVRFVAKSLAHNLQRIVTAKLFPLFPEIELFPWRLPLFKVCLQFIGRGYEM
jgi:hypothetical protein